MEETSTTIIGIIVAAVLMYLVPFFLLADRNDDVAQLIAQNATSTFVDTVIKNGEITQDDYDRYINDLASSGNTFDLDIEVKILDKNASQNHTNANSQEIGENYYYSLYTSQIEDKLSSESGGARKIVLKEGDQIFVTAKNSSKTLSQSLKNVYYKITGEDMYIIVATGAGTIAVNGAT